MTRFLTSIILILAFTVSGYAVDDKPQDEREGGIVGTGIVGTITELGSIYVNGQHVLYPEGTVVASPLGDRLAADLTVGETVALEAVRSNGGWHAMHIALYIPVVGPVSDTGPDGLTVLGSRINISVDTVFANGADDLAAGDWIAVYGLWRDMEVMGSRIVKIDPRDDAIIVGTLQPDAADGSIVVGGTRVTGITPRHAVPGSVVTVHGRPENGGIAAQGIAVGLFAGPVSDILMEGYLSQPGSQGLYTIYGSGVVAYAGDQPMTVPQGRGLYCAQSTERQPIVSLAQLPEDEAVRKRLLADVGRQAATQCGG